MSTTQPRRLSKVTVEYIRPSRASVQEYTDFLAGADTFAALTASYRPELLPSSTVSSSSTTSTSTATSPGQLPPSHIPSPSASYPRPLSTHRARTPPAKQTRARASLQKPGPKRSTPESLPIVQIVDRHTDPFAMAAATSPPPRPSRANTATLNDLYPTSHPHGHTHSQPQTPNQDRSLRRLSAPSAQQDSYFQDVHAQDITPDYPLSASHIHHHPGGGIGGGTRSRSGTTTGSKFSTNTQNSSQNKKGGMLSFMSFMSNNKRLEISTPYDPVHLTHVGFNASTGEFTGLPREWQQLLQDSGISRQDQERHPKEVMEIVKFYQGQAQENNVWEKMGAVKVKGPPPGSMGVMDDGFQNTVRMLHRSCREVICSMEISVMIKLILPTLAYGTSTSEETIHTRWRLRGCSSTLSACTDTAYDFPGCTGPKHISTCTQVTQCIDGDRQSFQHNRIVCSSFTSATNTDTWTVGSATTTSPRP